jgi:AhpD family alkylhydroperoxidase
MNRTNTTLSATAFALVATMTWAQDRPSMVQEPPTFYATTYPEYALESRLAAEAVLSGEKAELDAKTRELIALAVAAQIPCTYCIYFHDKTARANGASDSEVREAIATAAHVRHWSTVLNGMAYDFDAFKAEVDSMAKSN